MKHTVLLLILSLLSVLSYSQSNYDKGFKAGYEEGYCYNDFGCISPIIPLTPMLNIGENNDSYQDGYNRGFKMGMEDKQGSKAKTDYSNNSNQQVYSTYQHTYTPADLSAIRNELERRQAAYDNNKKYVDNLIDWIYDLKSKTKDQTFLDAMDIRYKKLRSFDGQDLSLLSDQIRQVELDIKEDINSYNARLESANDPVKYWNKGNDFLKEKKYRDAIQQYGYVAQLAPNFAESYLNRGYAYQSLGDRISAIEDFSKYIQIGGQNPLVYEYRGWAQYYQENYMKALADFNKQIENTPDSPRAYYNRGSAKSELNDYYGAINDYLKAIELNENFSMAYNNIAWAKFKLKKYSDALVDANKAINLDNKNYVAYDSRAEIKFHLKDYKGCISDSDNAINLNPKIANSYFLKGKASYELGDKQKACQYWSKAGELGKAEAYKLISEYCNN